METLEQRHVLSTITVTTIDDVVDANDGETSLREAIESASPAGGDTIEFSTDPEDGLNGGTIALNPNPGFRQVEFEKSLTIDASMLDSLTIDAAGNSRIFVIEDLTDGLDPPLVTLVGLTLTGGNNGALFSRARLVIRDCVITENDGLAAIDVGVLGGGATPRNVLTIEDSVFHDNDRGGVRVRSGNNDDPFSDIILITGTTFSNNTNGSGLDVTLHGASLTIVDSTFQSNEDPDGDGAGIRGELHAGASVEIVDSLFLQNTAGGHGSGIDVLLEQGSSPEEGSSLEVVGSTFIDNDTPGSGGAIHTLIFMNSSVSIADSTFALNDAELARCLTAAVAQMHIIRLAIRWSWMQSAR